MTWMEHHRVSEARFSDAEDLERLGDIEGARRAYRAAAEAEELALADLDTSKKRTRGISVVSIGALRHRAGEREAAERWVLRHLAATDLHEYSRMRLRELLKIILNEAFQQGPVLDIPPSELDISIGGGRTHLGAAPLELVTSVADSLRSILIRSAEFTNGIDYRNRGRPGSFITDRYQPQILQREAASFHFSIRLLESEPNRLRNRQEVGSETVVSWARDVLWAGIHSPVRELHELVPDPQYRARFLNLALQLAPSERERRLETIQIRSDRLDRDITLDRRSRRVLRLALKSVDLGEDLLVQMKGIVTAQNLVHDWIEVRRRGGTERIYGLSLDGAPPLRNWLGEEVTVLAERDFNGRLYLHSIGLALEQ